MQVASNEPIPMDQTLKERERARLAADVAAFVKGGGVIEQVVILRRDGSHPGAAASNKAFEIDD